MKAVRASFLALAGRLDEARALFKELEATETPTAEASVGTLTGTRHASSSLLAALGLNDLAHRRAEEKRAAALQQMQRGNRAPLFYSSLVQAEITLGHSAEALAALAQWRSETQRLPSASRRNAEFYGVALGCYAQLGKVDDEIALLRDYLANGYHLGYRLSHDPAFTAIRADPRFQELMKQEAAWAAALPDPTDL